MHGTPDFLHDRLTHASPHVATDSAVHRTRRIAGREVHELRGRSIDGGSPTLETGSRTFDGIRDRYADSFASTEPVFDATAMTAKPTTDRSVDGDVSGARDTWPRRRDTRCHGQTGAGRIGCHVRRGHDGFLRHGGNRT